MTSNRLKEAHRIVDGGIPKRLPPTLRELVGKLQEILEACRLEFGEDPVLQTELTSFLLANCEPFSSAKTHSDDTDDIRELRRMRNLAALVITHWVRAEALVEVEGEGAEDDPAYRFAEPKDVE